MNSSTGGASPPPSAPTRVLVVDDDVRFCSAMVRLLREEGLAAEGTGTVTGALDLLSAREFDVLLCDRRLPDGNGCDLMRSALRLRPMKGIAITGLAGDEEIAESRAAGFVDHLRKPVMIEDVLAAIRRALQGSES